MRLRRPVHRADEIGQGHMQFAGPSFRAEKQGGTAARTKAAFALAGRPVPNQVVLRIFDPALVGIQSDPGNESRATAALAHRAMAMRHPLAGQLRGELDVAAQAATAGWIHGTGPSRQTTK